METQILLSTVSLLSPLGCQHPGRFDDLVGRLVVVEGELRDELVHAREQLRGIGEQVRASRIDSPGMEQLGERVSRTLTAIENWIDVDDALESEDYELAARLQDRIKSMEDTDDDV